MTNIHSLATDHLSAMRRLMADYLREIDPDGDPEAIWGDEFFATCLQGMVDGTVLVLTAVEAGDLVGFSVARLDHLWYRRSITMGIIEEFYVAPPVRRMGLGLALAKETIATLRSRGATSLMATVVKGNPSALLFWQRVEFSIEGFVLFHMTS